MATSDRLMIISLVAIALVWANQVATCEEIDTKSDQKAPDETPSLEDTAATSKVQLKQSGLWPAFLFGRPARNKPNVFLIGIEPYYSMLPKPMQEMIDTQIRPQTDQMSEQILNSVPGAKEFYEQVSNFMQMFSQFGPQNFLGGGSGGEGGSGGLSSLLSGFGGRR